MWSKVGWFTPAGTMAPIGPYSHIAKVGQFITIGGTAGVDPATGDLVSPLSSITHIDVSLSDTSIPT